jgi:type 1 glutamine amidotransferase
MNSFKSLLVASAFCAAIIQTPLRAVEPIHALLITGGGTHDYAHQKTILTEGISARANVAWKIIFEDEALKAGEDIKKHEVGIYHEPDWTKGFDVVVHDECFGQVTNVAFIEHMAQAHSNGVAAVVLHCSIHAYRLAKTDEWRKVLGVSSYHHEARRPFVVENLKPEHPVMKGFPTTWKDFPDELYVISKLWPNCVPLAQGVGAKEGNNVCVWVNTYGKGRTFGTTLGHGNDTVESDVYLDLVTRGLLWACDKLDDDGKPKPGYGPVNTAAK